MDNYILENKVPSIKKLKLDTQYIVYENNW